MDRIWKLQCLSADGKKPCFSEKHYLSAFKSLYSKDAVYAFCN